MELLGVDELAARDIMTLSTGQARRVLIARALVHDPEVLVFDEPCTGLDPEGMYYVRSSMRTLAKAGKGIVLVTHYPEDIIPEIKRRRAIEKRYGVRRRVERPALDGWRDERAVRRSFARAAHDRRTFHGAGPRILLIPPHPPRRLRDQPYRIARFRDPLLTLRRHLLYPARRVRNPPRPVCKQTKISMMLVKRNISRL